MFRTKIAKIASNHEPAQLRYGACHFHSGRAAANDDAREQRPFGAIVFGEFGLFKREEKSVADLTGFMYRLQPGATFCQWSLPK
ncbi:hypothetical protein C241_14718 [Bradyrhizobium lupini HPC(L)]|uniref:Uncharacterized protein n=1 Tax=Bradyrhizobium lupini HPC(L) TaxID=1229491 RepID=A0ABP2RRB1_RHILU|nr:hypothetical protein C241_14718 [Bradyrhizobium lupini HPC(L)]